MKAGVDSARSPARNTTEHAGHFAMETRMRSGMLEAASSNHFDSLTSMD
jgi:hypothetical protein